jgi:hypothetical protein
MSGELRRVEVLTRVQAEELKLIDASSLMGVSYRQAKRIGKRYREAEAEGLKHRSAGWRSSWHKRKCWSANNRTERWRSSIGGRIYAGRRWRLRERRCVRPSRCRQFRADPSTSRRRTIRGAQRGGEGAPRTL